MLYNKCNKVSRREWILGPIQQATRGRTSKHKERDSVRRTPSGLMPTRSHTTLSQASLTYTSPPRAGQEFGPHPVEPAAHYITTEDNHPQDFKRRIRRA
ncbi:hypothetical protein NEUTE2DRAFT_155326 [Neurospora tetrasperma FGSC 2509]|nr:hypothetical protein NEUTE2DRAFT_155326 [Neurospora tetrasperma FGSC 2509]